MLLKAFLNFGEIIDIGVEMNIIKKSGSWFSYEDENLDKDVIQLNRF